MYIVLVVIANLLSGPPRRLTIIINGSCSSLVHLILLLTDAALLEAETQATPQGRGHCFSGFVHEAS